MTDQAASDFQPKPIDFLHVSLILLLFTLGLFYIQGSVSSDLVEAENLRQPIFAVVILTGIVWLTMVAVRNFYILKGLISAQYYVDYKSNQPDEWFERPARCFNNLLQVPVLFYLACVLIMLADNVTQTILVFAWLFAVCRILHAGIYIIFNRVKYRFTSWMTGCITLIFIWSNMAIS